RRISPLRLGHAFSTHGLTGNLGWALTPVFMTTLILLANWRVAAFGAAALVAAVLIMTIVWRHLIADDIPSDLAGLEPGAPVAPGTTTASVPTATAAAATFATATSVTATPATATPSMATATPGTQAVPTQASVAAQNQTAAPAEAAAPGLFGLLRNPALWAAFGFFACTSLALAAVQNYSIPLLQQLYALAPVAASGALSGYMLAAAGGMLAGGFLVNSRLNTELIVLVALVLAGCTLVWLALGGVPSFLAAPVVALAGFCAGIAGPSRDMLIRRVTPRGAMGSVYGLVYSGMDVGSAAAPLAFGLLLDRGHTSGPWVGAGVAFILGAILAQLIARHARLLGR
ncbi:MAG: MFS transporter, partial [Burkholderiaceae bacterium]